MIQVEESFLFLGSLDAKIETFPWLSVEQSDSQQSPKPTAPSFLHPGKLILHDQHSTAFAKSCHQSDRIESKIELTAEYRIQSRYDQSIYFLIWVKILL